MRWTRSQCFVLLRDSPVNQQQGCTLMGDELS